MCFSGGFSKPCAKRLQRATTPLTNKAPKLLILLGISVLKDGRAIAALTKCKRLPLVMA